MPAKSIFRLAAAAVISTGLAAPSFAQTMTPAAQKTMEALDAAGCSNPTDDVGTVVNETLVDCLRALKAETIAFANDQIALFDIHNDEIRRQNGFVAAQTHAALQLSCDPLSAEVQYETPQDALLDVTGKIATCTDTIYDSGHLKDIKYAFDEARHFTISLTSNCIRGLIDPNARDICANAKTKPSLDLG
ncbi:MAG TPA: hypothetical protein VIN59_02805, partial [Alphaproteobacteria bacterium]